MKQMNTTKQKRTHRCREQSSAYQLKEGMGQGQDRGRRLGGTNYYIYIYINKYSRWRVLLEYVCTMKWTKAS